MKYILTFVTFIETLCKRSGIKYEKNKKAVSISGTLQYCSAIYTQERIPKEMKIQRFVANAFCSFSMNSEQILRRFLIAKDL